MSSLKTTALFLCLCSGLTVHAQESGKMTVKKAETIIPREMKAPVKSMIPGEKAVGIDTLETSDPRIKIELRADGTWSYIKNMELFDQNDIFMTDWSTTNISPYHTQLSALPDKITIWMVDDASHFCCPRQIKVYSKFGYRHRRRHQGVDLPLPIGTPVYAAFDGKVRISQYSRGYGNLVIIRHENGLETYYGHLSKRNVEAGQFVKAGDIIGLGGSTGRSTGPHLHFETRYKGYAFDPQWLIDFETGTLRTGVFNLKKKYLSAESKYVPESEEVEEEVMLDEEADQKAVEEQIAKEEKAAKDASNAVYHKVKSGDTLYTIAKRNGTTVNKLCRLNNISKKAKLRIGQKIRVK